jgi:hypothetical protein
MEPFEVEPFTGLNCKGTLLGLLANIRLGSWVEMDGSAMLQFYSINYLLKKFYSAGPLKFAHALLNLFHLIKSC